MTRFWKNNGLTITMLALFTAFGVGQFVAGYLVLKDELREHGQPTISMVQYLCSGHFVEATFENWESEFLQMGSYVLLTSFLFQKGSAESRPPEEAGSGIDHTTMQRGGRAARASFAYRHSLSLALFALFGLSFGLHLLGGTIEYNRQQALLHEAPVSLLEFLQTSEFWFQSFQNWQSEYLSVAVLVLLSIWLREEDSPESKPVDAPNDQTGD